MGQSTRQQAKPFDIRIQSGADYLQVTNNPAELQTDYSSFYIVLSGKGGNRLPWKNNENIRGHMEKGSNVMSQEIEELGQSTHWHASWYFTDIASKAIFQFSLCLRLSKFINFINK